MRSRRTSAKKSFTLVELLVVIAIASILAVLSLAAYQQIVSSSTLNSATLSLTGALDQARQAAITRNTDVEVRFYQLPNYNSSTSGTLAFYRAFQTFLVTSSSTNALTKVTFFPAPIIMQNTPLANSTLLNSGLDTNNLVSLSGTNATLPTYQNNYSAMAFRFSPKGSLYLDNTKQWYVTIMSSHDKLNTNNFPANYATIQIDPFTGRTRYFRP